MSTVQRSQQLCRLLRGMQDQWRATQSLYFVEGQAQTLAQNLCTSFCADSPGRRLLQTLMTTHLPFSHRHHLLAPTQRMFTFVHPNRAPAIDNNRYKRAVWQRPREAGSGLLHGFAGWVAGRCGRPATLPAIWHKYCRIPCCTICLPECVFWVPAYSPTAAS